MSTALSQRPAQAGRPHGGLPGRRAVMRWAWRMFRREWRQQLLILALIVVAVAATVIGAAVAADTPPAANAGYGTAQDLAGFPGRDPDLAAQIAALQHRFGRVDVIENQTIPIPGSIDTYDLRAQNPHGPYGQPMLSLVSGHYPTGPGQVAVTSGVASAFNLKIGDVWRQDGTARRVVGIVQNPQSLLDEFALVVPGQVKTPTQVTVLFDAPGVRPGSIGPNVQTPHSATSSNVLNPETISIVGVTVGMLLIALVGVAGFTVLAQRRLRSIGMLASIGGTDKQIRLVVRANGVVVGLAGAVIGLVVGLAGWLAYRPRLEASAHHLIGPFQLPWTVIAVALILAVIATYFAASRPARSIARVPIVTALSGRPTPPKPARRWALPAGVVSLVLGFVLLGMASAGMNPSGSGGGNSGTPELVFGIVALVVSMILLAPFCLTLLARLGGHTHIAVRLALRDLSRYRARSGSALAAISLGVFIAVLICVEVAARFGNVLDYAGPNLAPNQIIVYAPGSNGGGSGPGAPPTRSQLASAASRAHAIAAALGSRDVVQLDLVGATLQHAAPGRQWSGTIYVATPQLLRAFGIKASEVDPRADVLTMRPGLSGISKMQLVYGGPRGGNGPPGGPNGSSYPCPKSYCVANPVIQEISALPSGTSAPNTVVTEHAIQQFHLQANQVDGWLIQAPHPPTAAQITNARLAASAAGMSIETKNSIPTTATILNWATVFGVVLALAILAMSVGLIRSETASDLRTLAATGASSSTRRTLTAVTAGALGLLGAVLGTAAAYLGAVAFARNSSLDGLSSLGYVPVTNLLIILVGMPLLGAAAGWLLAGREPPVISRQPLE